MTQLNYTIEIQLTGGHKPVDGTEVEGHIERAAYDAVGKLLDPDELEVAVEEA